MPRSEQAVKSNCLFVFGHVRLHRKLLSQAWHSGEANREFLVLGCPLRFPRLRAALVPPGQDYPAAGSRRERYRSQQDRRPRKCHDGRLHHRAVAEAGPLDPRDPGPNGQRAEEAGRKVRESVAAT